MKQKTVYICRECGFESLKWVGKCSGCGHWDTMDEQINVSVNTKNSLSKAVLPKGNVISPSILKEVDNGLELRFDTGIGELNRVLGGGLVKGSVLLIGGDPGIGKSTLILQMCGKMSVSNKILYVSGEESPRQIKMRANRLFINSDELMVLCHTNIADILSSCMQCSPDIIVIDSIQTMFRPEITSAPGSIGQVRECAMALMQYAKANDVTVIMIGHVTKEGGIAGPKTLEHMVDCVLYFEGDNHHMYRILRSAKNRFGATWEMGVFEMAQEGLREISNPSAIFLTDRETGISGSCISCTLEGSRPLLAEVQALVTPTSFGVPRRMCTGFDYNRTAMLTAVLEKRAGLRLGSQDIYINITGGFKLNDPAIDLSVALSIASSFKDKPVWDNFAAIGEIGLSGEIRPVSNLTLRIVEAKKLGITKFLIPVQRDLINEDLLNNIEIYKAKNIYQTINLLF